MKQYKILVILGIIITIGVAIPAYAIEDENSLLVRITELEKKIVDKDKILFEQTKVILELSKNYKPTYDLFSLEKYPKTGGFNPAWLDGEREKILAACQEAHEMGYENSYCKYLQ